MPIVDHQPATGSGTLRRELMRHVHDLAALHPYLLDRRDFDQLAPLLVGRHEVPNLLTGDSAGYYEGQGFHRTLERIHKRGWRVEVLSWAHSCNEGMRRWAEANGVFVPLDDHYEAITFREPSRPGHELALSRDQAPLDLARRRMA